MVHAQGEAEYWVIDLGSSNGTYLNGRRVSQPCRLAEGDRIEIGGFNFVFRNPRLAPTEKVEQATEKTVQDIKSVNCWLLIADMECSTQLAQRLPENEAPRVMGRWLADCKQIVDDHSGTINKFLGDGFFAYWPDGRGVASSVANALKALQNLQATVQFRFRVVLHFGPVYVGGAASLGEESLLGNEVNFIFRMEKVAASMGLCSLLSERAHEQMQSLVPVTATLRREVPGFSGEFVFHSF